MRTVYHEAPYSKRAGHKFDREQLLKELSDYSEPFYKEFRLIFGKGKEIYRDEYREMHALVANPSAELLKSLLGKYMSTHRITGVRHESNLHSLDVSEDGRVYLKYLFGGEDLINSQGIYTRTFKNKDELMKTVKEWSKISLDLGFKTYLPQTVRMEDGCHAVKLCTQKREMEREDVAPYIMDTLVNTLNNPKNSIRISSPETSLTLDKNSFNMHLGRNPEKEEAEDALSLMGDIEKEPTIRWRIQTRTFLDELKEYEDTFKGIGLLSALPAIFGFMGALWGSKWNSLYGAAIGVAVGFGIDGALFGYVNLTDRWDNYREEKRRLERKKHEILGRYGRSLPHLKESEGFCVVVSTDKCALKAAKKNEEQESLD